MLAEWLTLVPPMVKEGCVAGGGGTTIGLAIVGADVALGAIEAIRLGLVLKAKGKELITLLPADSGMPMGSRPVTVALASAIAVGDEFGNAGPNNDEPLAW